MGADLQIDRPHPPGADCQCADPGAPSLPGSVLGTQSRGTPKKNPAGLRPSRNDESHRQLNSHSMRAYCPGEATRRNERTNGQKTRSTSRRAGAQEAVLYLWREKSFVVNGASRRHMRRRGVFLFRADFPCEKRFYREKSRCCHSCGGSARS